MSKENKTPIFNGPSPQEGLQYPVNKELFNKIQESFNVASLKNGSRELSS